MLDDVRAPVINALLERNKLLTVKFVVLILVDFIEEHVIAPVA